MQHDAIPALQAFTRQSVAANDSVWWNHVTLYLCRRTCDVIVFTIKVKLQLNATNEIVAADAAADNNSNSSSDDNLIMTSHSHALIDSDSPTQIIK